MAEAASPADPTRRTVLQVLLAMAAGSSRPAQAGVTEKVLTAALSPISLGPDAAPTPMLAFDGQVPGPVLRVGQGEELAIQISNKLNAPLTFIWHGLRERDGGRDLDPPPIAPGATGEMRLISRDAGTFWYLAAARIGVPASPLSGLYGVLIVDEPEPPLADRDYVCILDRLPAPVGSGDRWQVMPGSETPLSLRTHERVRLRLLNAAPASIAPIGVEGLDAILIALDGQPLNEPIPLGASLLPLAPGGTADLLIDRLDGPAAAMLHLADAAGRIDLLPILKADGAARSQALPVPKSLPTNGLPEAIDLAAALRVDLSLGKSTGSPDAGTPPLFTGKPGQPVVMTLSSAAAGTWAVHIDGHPFRLLHTLDDGWDPYWLTTTLVGEADKRLIAFVPDRPGSWRIEATRIGEPQTRFLTWFAVR